MHTTNRYGSSLMKSVEIFSGMFLKNCVFWGPFTCLDFNAAHHGDWGKVAVVNASAVVIAAATT